MRYDKKYTSKVYPRQFDEGLLQVLITKQACPQHKREFQVTSLSCFLLSFLLQQMQNWNFFQQQVHCGLEKR